MDYPIQVPVTDFAQLALDVYEDPDANDVRPGFTVAWARLYLIDKVVRIRGNNGRFGVDHSEILNYELELANK